MEEQRKQHDETKDKHSARIKAVEVGKKKRKHENKYGNDDERGGEEGRGEEETGGRLFAAAELGRCKRANMPVNQSVMTKGNSLTVKSSKID